MQNILKSWLITDTTCETNINECDSDPCEHNGTCEDQINGFTCNCPSGWTGKYSYCRRLYLHLILLSFSLCFLGHSLFTIELANNYMQSLPNYTGLKLYLMLRIKLTNTICATFCVTLMFLNSAFFLQVLVVIQTSTNATATPARTTERVRITQMDLPAIVHLAGQVNVVVVYILIVVFIRCSQRLSLPAKYRLK